PPCSIPRSRPSVCCLRSWGMSSGPTAPMSAGSSCRPSRRADGRVRGAENSPRRTRRRDVAPRRHGEEEKSSPRRTQGTQRRGEKKPPRGTRRREDVERAGKIVFDTCPARLRLPSLSLILPLSLSLILSLSLPPSPPRALGRTSPAGHKKRRTGRPTCPSLVLVAGAGFEPATSGL